jgi:hypothetical protein
MDKRVRLMLEIINNIRAVKLHAYESHMSRKVSDVREKEMKLLRVFGILRSMLSALFDFVPVLAIVCE